MMRQCWAYNSQDRPHFANIYSQLDGLGHSKMVRENMSPCEYIYTNVYESGDAILHYLHMLKAIYVFPYRAYWT